MATSAEAEARAWVDSSPEVVSDVLPAQIKEMRVKRLRAANMVDGKIANVNWIFTGPNGEQAHIMLQHPSTRIPNYDTDSHQMATFTIQGAEGAPDISLLAQARLGGVKHDVLGLDLRGDASFLGPDPTTGLQTWLNAADQNQQGCINVVAYTNDR
jgi:hypothetical protein